MEANMNKKVIAILVAGLLLVSCGWMAWGQMGQKRMGKNMRMGFRMAEKNLFPPQMLLRMQDEIGLTQQQVDQINDLNDNFTEMKIRKQADIKVEELKFRSYLKKDKIDRKKLEKMIRKTSKLKTDFQIQKIYHLLDVKSILTAEQVKKVEKLKKEFRKRAFKRFRQNRDGRRGHRGKRGGGQEGCSPQGAME